MKKTDCLTSPQLLDRRFVITALSNLCAEWREAADGEPLNTVQGNVGLLIEDVCTVLGLTELEKGEVQGQWRLGMR